jgi:hypothetical protein
MKELIEKLKALAEEYKKIKAQIIKKQPKIEEGIVKFEGKKEKEKETVKESSSKKESEFGANPLEILANPLVKAALNKLATIGPSDVQLLDKEAKKATEINKKRKKEGKKLDENGKEVSSYLVEDEMKALAQANFEAKAKFKNLAEGLDVLVKAGVVAEVSYKLNAEYKNAIGSAKGSVAAAAKAYAKFDATLKAFDLKAGILIDAKVKAQVGVEATVKASGEVQVTAIPLVDILGKVDAEAYARAQATASGELVLSAEELTGALNLEAGASVGVKVEGELVIKSKSGTPLITLRGNASAEVGAKAKFNAKFQIKDGKLIISVNTALVVGVGTELGGSIEIDFKAIGKLIADAFKKDPAKFADRLRQSFEKIKEKALEVKADLEEDIAKAKAKLYKSKEKFDKKMSQLKDKIQKKTSDMLKKAENKIAFYEGKIKGIKDDGRAKVVENLESAKATISEIQNWLDTKFDSLFD